MATHTTNLNPGDNSSFSQAMTGGFGIVTVMNVDVYDALETDEYKQLTPYDIVKGVGEDGTLALTVGSKSVSKNRRCRIDTLKVANATQEGPTKTITGGQYTNPLMKFGKTSRLEMQDALGSAEAIEALGGAVSEWTGEGTSKVYTALHVGSEFAGTKLLIGDSFIMDRKYGKQVKVKIIFYQFLPDSVFNLTQDSEGDATVFDMNGDLLTTDIVVGDNKGTPITRGMFYSIIADEQPSDEE